MLNRNALNHRLMFPDLRIDPLCFGACREWCEGYLRQDLAVRLLTPGIKPLILSTQGCV